MDDSSRKTFSETLTVLGEIAGAPVSPTMIGAYWVALRDMDMSDFKRAVASIMATTTDYYGRLPAPGSIRKASLGDTEGAAAVAWVRISSLIRNGLMPTVAYRLDDPLAHAALRSLGGSQALGQMAPEEFETWGRKRYVEEYCRLAASGIPEDLTHDEPGIYDSYSVGGQVVTNVVLQLGTGRKVPQKSLAASNEDAAKVRALIGGIG